VIDVLNGKRCRRELAQNLLSPGATLATCPITVTEVYAGLRPGEEAKTDRFLRSLKFFTITWEISKKAGDLICHWKQQGRTFSLPDMAIAAVAVTHDLVLVTSNIKDFPMPELRLYPLAESGA
jgi:predicted nucleic acid-binding protein